MGASLTNPSPLLRETETFARFTLSDLRLLHSEFTKLGGFSMIRSQFLQVLSFRESSFQSVSLDKVFDAIDNDGDGRIDGLEFLGGVALVCRGTFDEKAKFAFELYDFNLNASLSITELAMMLQSSVCGMLVLTGGLESDEPPISLFEDLAEEAMRKNDADNSNAISYSEFVEWARSNVKVMSALAKLATVASSSLDSSDSSSSSSPSSLVPVPTVDDEDPSFLPSEMSKTSNPPRPPLVEAVNNLSSSLIDALLYTDQYQNAIKSREHKVSKANYAQADSTPTHPSNPPTHLSLDWIYGYNSSNARQNVRYLTTPTDSPAKDGPTRFAYPAARVGVVYNKITNAQTFYHGHTDEILSLAVHPAGNFVATGQAGNKCVIHVWDATTLQTTSVLNLHTVGVNLLAFNVDGAKLCSVGRDSDHIVALWDWRANKMVASGIGGPNNLLDTAFSSNNQTICCVGVRTILFFEQDKRALKSKPAILSGDAKRQTFCSVAYVHDQAFVGCYSGEIYKFGTDRRLLQTFQAHGVNEPVNSLFFNPETSGLISGGKDGLCVLWDKQMKMVGSNIDMAEDVGSTRIGTMGTIIDCSVISAVSSGNFMLVSTRGGDIFEIKKSSPNPYVKQVVCSHTGQSLGSLASHPTELVIASTGDDKTLRIWSVRRHCLIDMRVLPSPGTALDFSPKDGHHLCLGMTSGAIAIFDMTLNVKHAFKHSNHPISAVKYSPSQHLLAVGSLDTNIYLYAADKSYSRLGVCRGHTAAITHLDFSHNSLLIQSNDASYGIRYWNHWGEATNMDSFCTAGTQSPTCTLTWQCLGVWEQCTVADFGSVTTVNVDKLTDVLCCGDEYGRIKLFNYPVLGPNNLFSCTYGHAGPVAKVRFGEGGHYLYSAGTDDCCVFQWHHKLEEYEPEEGEEGEYSIDHVVEAENDANAENLVPSMPAIQESDSDDSGGSDKGHPMKTSSPFDAPPLATILTTVARTNKHLLDELEAAEVLVTRSETIACDTQIKHYLSKIVEPSDYHFSDDLLGSTDTMLNLSWVHGYRSQDCRNTLRYSSSGGVIFTAAALGVCYDKSRDVQRFQQGTHTDDILCLSIHPDGNYCATGEVGDMPKIVVWDCSTMDTKAVLVGFHKRGVSTCAFNHDGSLLLSVGLDDYNSVAIYNWEQERVIATAVVSSTKVMAACFVGSKEFDNERVLLGGKQFLKFFKVQGDSCVCQNGVFNNNTVTTQKDFFCMNAVPVGPPQHGYTVTTGVRGEVLLWDGFKCRKECHSVLSGKFRHTESVDCLWAGEERAQGVAKYRVVTGDKGGTIAVWDFVMSGKEMDRGCLVLNKVLRLSDVRQYLPNIVISDVGVRSVCMMNDALLIGTAGSEIFEITLSQALDYKEAIGRDGEKCVKHADAESIKGLSVTCFNEGHYSGDVWGLATHPSKDLFATGGDDCMVRLWGYEERNCVRVLRVEHQCRSLAYQPGGVWNQERPHLAVGDNDGTVVVVDGELKVERDAKNNIKYLAKLSNASQWIQEMKYSFEGSRLVVGSHDFGIYVYDVFNAYSFVGKIDQHVSYITHIDMGMNLEDGCVMDEKGRIVNMDSGMVTRNVEVEDIYMQTSCGDKHLKFFNLKTLEEETSANKMKDVCYSSVTNTIGFSVQGIGGKQGCDGMLCVDRNHIYDRVPVLATGDEFGVIRLYNYPCVNSGAAEKTYLAHAAAVRGLGFSHDDGFMVSVGGQDRAVCVWKTDIKEEARELAAAGGSMNGERRGEQVDGGEGGDEEAEEGEGEINVFGGFKGGRSGGDEFLCVKPYLGAIREPSGWKEGENDDQKPSSELGLEFAFGYRAQDCRSNLFFGDSPTEIVYHVAGIGIKYDMESKQQLFNLQHDDDIVCCAVHPEGHTVATGELGKKPKIVLWDSNSGSTLAVCVGFHSRGVNLIQFSGDGKLVYSVGMDDDHSVAVYGADPDTNMGQLIAKAKGSRSKMLGLCSLGARDFCTAGKREVKFWSCDVVKGEISSKKGLFGKKAGSTTCVSCCYLGPDCVTGQVDGSLYLWKGRNVSVVRREHGKCVNTLGKWGGGLVSGGKDGLVILWSESLVKQRVFDLNDFKSDVIRKEVRSVCCMEQKVLVGAYSSEILELDLATGEDRLILSGHYGGELWGLDNNPVTSNVCTVGDDGLMCVWDTKKCERVGVGLLGGKARSVSYNDDGTFIAVGMYSGNVVVFEDGSGKLTKKVDVKIAKEWIQVLKYSPDGSHLAVGSHDNCIYLVETRTYTRRVVCKGHSSFITHLDWSADSKFIQSNCGAYELLFWNAKDGKQVKNPSSLKDTVWASWTCVLGWPVQGIWGQGKGGGEIDACCRVGSNLVVGGDDGKVSLFRYPCLKVGSGVKEYSGHSSHVTNVVGGFDGDKVFSVGGLDRALLQFGVSKGISSS